VESKSRKVIDVADIEEKWQRIEENARKLGALCSRVDRLESKGPGNNNSSNDNELNTIRGEQHGNGVEPQVQIKTISYNLFQVLNSF
jgi:hypothetical protein